MLHHPDLHSHTCLAGHVPVPGGDGPRIALTQGFGWHKLCGHCKCIAARNPFLDCVLGGTGNRTGIALAPASLTAHKGAGAKTAHPLQKHDADGAHCTPGLDQHHSSWGVLPLGQCAL